MGQLDIDDATGMELVLVSEEILTNIHKHAQLPNTAQIELTVWTDHQGISLEFSDEGFPFNPIKDSHRSTLGSDIVSAEIGGLGVHLVTQLTDKQSYRRHQGRNVLTVLKFFDSEETQ
jgi:sigma-B regulation protein RsbU (phosphoserine phosphatase)